jgi:hypothetical protein
MLHSGDDPWYPSTQQNSHDDLTEGESNRLLDSFSVAMPMDVLAQAHSLTAKLYSDVVILIQREQDTPSVFFIP